MSSGRARASNSRRRRWLVEPLETRIAPSDTLVLLGSLAAAMRSTPPAALTSAANAGYEGSAQGPRAADTRLMYVSRGAQPRQPVVPPTQDGAVSSGALSSAARSSGAVDAIFSTEFVGLAQELALGGTREQNGPAPAPLSARPPSMAAGTGDTAAPGGAAGSSGAGGGGGSGGIDGAAAAMAASVAAAAVPTSNAMPSTPTASTATGSAPRSLVATDDYIPPPPDAFDQSFSTYHDTQFVEPDPGLVGNDFGNVTCVRDSDPTLGQITDWDGQGGFTYTPNYHAYGTDSFTFHEVDSYGQSSNEATVTMDVTETAPEAYADGTFWGDWNKTATSGNTITVDAFHGVLGNDTDPDGPDTGNLQAVIDTDPTNGSLTLNSDGSFIYVPNIGFGGYDQFTYYATDGIMNSASVAVSLAVQKVDLDMWDGGPDGTEVPDAKENSRGAYAVVNQNDTNGDDTVDDMENTVAVTANGRAEVDLMKLVINKPDPVSDGESWVTLSASPGLALWRSPTKGSPFTLYDDQAEINVLSLPMTLYVEATQQSQSLRDMTVSAQYNDSTDSVAVTGIWSKLTGAATDTMTAQQVLNEFPDVDSSLALYVQDYGGSGIKAPDNVIGVRNDILLQFTVYPSRNVATDGTWEDDQVFFDAARQLEHKFYRGTPLQLFHVDSFPTTSELPDDDGQGSFDESDAVTETGHFYSYDVPGFTNNVADSTEKELIWNMREFLRVDIDGARPTGNNVEGSRCSDYYPWYAMIDVVNDNGSWARSSKENTNKIGIGGPISLDPI